MQRRTLVRAAISSAPLSLVAVSGWIPGKLIGAWPDDAFRAESPADALEHLFGRREIVDSDRIRIDTPDIAENGAVVPVEVQSELPATASISVLSETNPFPLLFTAHLTMHVRPRVALRVKLGGSGRLVAIVSADGGLYRATRSLKVTAGGCGG